MNRSNAALSSRLLFLTLKDQILRSHK